MSGIAVSLDHLRRLTDDGGLHEHALLTVPRPEHGYCLDDVARALVVVTREPSARRDADELRRQYLSFVLAAQAADGRFRNRPDADGGWSGEGTVEDCWGRAMWALGETARTAPEPTERASALAGFDRGSRWRSPWSRSAAFAGLGADAVLAVRPGDASARALLAAAAERIGPSEPADWRWPEPRLTYANAVLPEVLLAAGAALGRPELLARGLDLLGWLLAEETADDHLSVTPVGGRGPGDLRPGFDQQPIEVAALADACARAYELTCDARWAAGVELAAAWFLGANDVGVPLADIVSGGGCDGLERLGRNENQGAESTLALLSTFQQLGRVTAPLVP